MDDKMASSLSTIEIPQTDIKTLEKKLRPREKRFCQLLVNKYCYNQTRAYMEAYSNNRTADILPQTAAARACELRRKSNIEAYISALEAENARNYNITAPSAITQFQELMNDPDATVADKLRATENIAKIAGLYSDSPNNNTNIMLITANPCDLTK